MLNLDYRHILSALNVGLEIEFYSKLSRKEIARLLGPHIKKKIIPSNAFHGKTEVSQHKFKVEADYSGGIYMNEIITGVMPYEEARIVLIRILNWINKNGWTDERTAIQFNISFDKSKIDLVGNIESINRLKYVLGFDEKYVYERFPKRRNNIYARSINQVYPTNRFIYNDRPIEPNPNHYHLPGDKYYGINFAKVAKGYLEVRYMGGRGYEKKLKEILEIISYTGLFTYDVLQSPNTYSVAETTTLNRILREYKKVVTSFSDLEAFFYNYPNIKISVDLKTHIEVLKTYWTTIRDKLFDLIVMSGLKKGKLNYDADVAKFQLKDAICRKAFPLDGMEIFDSKLQGNITNCDLYNCEIRNAHLLDCNLYRNNKVSKSRIITTPIHYNNETTDCFIDNRRYIINGVVDMGIIRSGEVGALAKISSDTEIIQGAVSYLAGEEKEKGKKKEKEIKGMEKKPISGIQTL